MTPALFEAAYRPEALILASRTGLEPDLFLAQWAVETGWGGAWAGAPNNLGNIECGPGVFCQYGSLSEFCDAEAAVLRQANMAGILAAAGSDLVAQFAALGQSPWDAGHYLTDAEGYQQYGPGGKLLQYWEEMRMAQLDTILSYCKSIYEFLNPPGVDVEGGAQRVGIVESIKTEVDTLLKAQPAPGGLTAAQATQLQETHDRVVKDLAT